MIRGIDRYSVSSLRRVQAQPKTLRSSTCELRGSPAAQNACQNPGQTPDGERVRLAQGSRCPNAGRTQTSEREADSQHAHGDEDLGATAAAHERTWDPPRRCARAAGPNAAGRAQRRGTRRAIAPRATQSSGTQQTTGPTLGRAGNTATRDDLGGRANAEHGGATSSGLVSSIASCIPVLGLLNLIDCIITGSRGPAPRPRRSDRREDKSAPRDDIEETHNTAKPEKQQHPGNTLHHAAPLCPTPENGHPRRNRQTPPPPGGLAAPARRRNPATASLRA